MFLRSLILGAVLCLSPFAVAQVRAAANYGAPILTAGGFYSYFDADYESYRITGTGAYIDWTPSSFWHFGVEAESRWLTFSGANNFREYNYLAGPRYTFPIGRRLHPYAKILAGAGEIDFPYQLAHGGYFAIAPGGGVDFRLHQCWRLRADYEYQIWPGSVGAPGIPSSALKPNGVSLGASFGIFNGRSM
jgi:opacity protein-like surface antigen